MNRAKQIWYNCEEKHRQLEQLSGIGEIGRSSFLRDRYNYLRHGLYRLSINPTPEEKLFTDVIRSVTARLRKELYPNIIVRSLIGIKEFLFDRPIHLKQFEKEKQKSLELLKQQFREKGFDLSLIIPENLLKRESESLQVSLCSQLKGGNRLYLDITFQQKVPGQILLEQYEVSFVENGSYEKKTLNFSANSDITIKEALNLLEGRAIRKPFETINGSTSHKWLQVDSFKSDEKNLKIIEFAEDYPFDLKKELKEFSHNTGITGLTCEAVLRELEKGNRIEFTGRDKQVYRLQADPAAESLLIIDKSDRFIGIKTFIEDVRKKQSATKEIPSLAIPPEQQTKRSMNI